MRIFIQVLLIGMLGNPVAAQILRQPPPSQVESRNKPSIEQELAVAEVLMEQHRYYRAIEFYKQVLDKAKDDTNAVLPGAAKTHVHYQMGEANRKLRFYFNAGYWYQLVTISEHADSFPLSRYWLAAMHQANGSYKRAADSYRQFLAAYNGEEEIYKERAERGIKSCSFALEAQERPKSTGIKNLGEQVNRAYADFAAVLKEEDRILYTTTTPKPIKNKVVVPRTATSRRRIWKTDTAYVNRLYQAVKMDSSWKSEGQLELNTDCKKCHIGSPTLSPDKMRLYFTICEGLTPEDMACAIYVSWYDTVSSKWDAPDKLGTEVNLPGASSKHPMSMQKNGKEWLFFASNRLGSIGGFDIYFVPVDNVGRIGYIESLGDHINTREDEGTPYYDAANKVLYFSSRGHIGFGGFDIHKVEGDFDDGWEKVENLGSPINTRFDDYYYYPLDGDKEGFLSSNRLQGFSLDESTCCDDIYYFKTVKLRLTGKLLEVLSDTVHKPLKRATLQLYNVNKKTGERKLLSEKDIQADEAGNYEIPLWPEHNYDVVFHKKDDDKKDSFRVNTEGQVASKAFTKDALLAPKPAPTIQLSNVHFGINGDRLQEGEKAKLDELVAYLKQYKGPQLVVKLEGHTDILGAESDNINLSQQRAEAVANYLRKQDVPDEQITIVGKGENEPVALNYTLEGKDNPEGRQKNRRVEIILIGPDSNQVATSKEERSVPEIIDMAKAAYGKVFSVQILSLSSPIRPERLAGLFDKVYHYQHEGADNYTVGMFNSFEDARTYKKTLIQNQVIPGGTIVMFQGGRLANILNNK